MRIATLTTIAVFSLTVSAARAQETTPKAGQSSSQAGAPAAAPAPAGKPPGGTMHKDGKPHGGMMHGMRGGESMACPMADTCPMKMQNVQVRARDVENGATLTFTTTGDVAALRERVRKLAEMHAQGCPKHKVAQEPAQPASPRGKPAGKAP